MQPSKYQQAIIEWACFGVGSSCINAAAGSGKSASLRMTAQALEANGGVSPRDIRIIVFGKANANQLISSFDPRWAKSISTLHSAGWSILRSHLSLRKPRGLVNTDKYKKISSDLGLVYRRKLTGELQKAIDSPGDFFKLIDLIRLTNLKPTEVSVTSICRHFDLDDAVHDFEPVAEAIAYVLEAGERLAIERKSFDFTDMVWLPVQWDLGSARSFRPYKFVLVDECQDLNATQLELSTMLAGADGRMLFVGDPRQAIMGFAGADCDSYRTILERVGGTELPLSVCYRCPRSHIQLVNKIFPTIEIEPAPTAREGKIAIINETQLKGIELTERDLIISRKTAPLVGFCIRLIASGVAAIVKGRAIGESLCKILKEIDKLNFPFDRFTDALDLYRAAKADQYRGLDNADQLIELLKDKIAAICAIYRALPTAQGIWELKDYINNLFSDNSHGLVTLCTCHRAKGLEADRIFLYKPGDMPMTWRTIKPWQEEQENNLLYVALTRSKSELYIVGEPDWLPDEEEEETSVRPLALCGEVAS